METGRKLRHASSLVGHPYPLRIGTETVERLQAAISHLSLIDFATDDYMRGREPIEKFHRYLTSENVDEDEWQTSWRCMSKHSDSLRPWVLQQAIIALRTQWDWYVSRLAEFLCFARGHVAGPAMSNGMEGKLARLGWAPMSDQLKCMQDAVGRQLELTESDRELVAEMSLVRNLVLHNRGEVDRHYLKHTKQTSWRVGQSRTVEWKEAARWHVALTRSVTATNPAVSEVYASAPSYPHSGGGA